MGAVYTQFIPCSVWNGGRNKVGFRGCLFVYPFRSYQCVLESCLKILVYGLNYSPELTGVGKYTGEMAAWLAARGHEVRVVTAPPYYPAWRIDDRYRGTRYRVESQDGRLAPRVYRCPLWVPARPRGLTRLVHLSSFAVSSIPIMAIQTLWKPDLVFTVEPTFFAAPVALLSALLSGASSWLHVQDFEVDAAFDLGMLPAHGSLHAVAKSLEGFFTSCFSRVSSVSDKMVERIISKGNVRNGVVLFPNWGDIESVRPASPDVLNSFRSELGLTQKIVFLYSGNMGEKQGLSVLGPLVASFSNDARVHFLFCGDGVYRPKLEKLLAHRANVTLLPLQPTDRLNDLLNSADIHLLPQRRGAADLVMPSKLNGILASGRPVIAIADEGTQVARVVAGCGLVVPPDDPQALVAAAVRLVEQADLRLCLGLAAREYAVKHLSKDRVLKRFELDVLALLTLRAKSKEIHLAQSYRS